MKIFEMTVPSFLKGWTKGTALMVLFLFSLALSAANESIRIMTFNIPMGNIKPEEGNGQNTWENRCKAIQGYLKDVNPDLLGMQEPVNIELRNILSGMPGYAMVGMARDDGKERGEYTPIIYRLSRFRVLATGNYWLTNTPDVVSKVSGSTHNRIATWALFEDLQTGARFLYTNTHLSYDSPAVKFEQIKIMKTHMKELNDKYGTSLPHLLTGDFNMLDHDPDDNNYNYVLNYQLMMSDMWTSAQKRVNNGGDRTGRIDYIYGTKNITSKYAQWDKRTLTDGYIMSDHDPLFADVQFTTSTADNARGAIAEAWAQIDSTYDYTYGHAKLITSSSQLSADAIKAAYPLKNMVDNNTATFTHSEDNGTAPNNPHYVQVKLNSPINAFRFTFQIRQDNVQLGYEDRWQDILVEASNDGETWDYITSILNFGADVITSQTSPVVEMHKEYSYVRLSVMHTPSMKIRLSSPQWSCSEFNMYKCTLRSTSEYDTYESIRAAVDALILLIRDAEGKLAANNIKRTDVTALNNAITALKEARKNPTSAIVSLKADDRPSQAVYNLQGRPLAAPQRGLNIVGDKVVLVK